MYPKIAPIKITTSPAKYKVSYSYIEEKIKY